MKHVLYLAMPYDSGQSGISRYIQGTLTAMANQTEAYQLTVCATASDILLLQSYLKEVISAQNYARVSFLSVSERYASPVANLFWFHSVLPILAQKLHRQHALDAVFFPAGNRRLSPFLKYILPRVERWITVHDLAPMRLKKYDTKRQFYTTRYLPWCYRQEPHLFAISQQTAEDLTVLAKVDAKCISVNLNGYTPLQHDKKAAPPALTKSSRPYLLYTARLEHPAKNHEGLIKAWASLPLQIQQTYQLIFVGKDWQGAEIIHEQIRQYHQSTPNGQISCAGFVSDKELASLYAHATLYVQPSLYEGFGLPLLEAMAVQTPVLSTRCGALPEVGGNTILYCEPNTLASKLKDLLSPLHDGNIALEQYQNLLPQAKRRAQGFSWDAHVTRFNTQKQPETPQILGQSLFAGSRNSFFKGFKDQLKQGKRQRVFFANADCLNQSVQNTHYAEHFANAEWRLPDGIGVKLAAKLTGQSLPHNLNGTDLFPYLCDLAVQENLSVFFLGATPNVNQDLCKKMQQRYPQLKIHGAQHGFFSPEKTPEVLAQIQGADLLFVAMGVPLQEAWIQEHWNQLTVKAAFGVGGLFDFYSGHIQRAPKMLRQLKLEWTWRLFKEPKRLWKRYILGNPLFISRVLRVRKLT